MVWAIFFNALERIPGKNVLVPRHPNAETEKIFGPPQNIFKTPSQEGAKKDHFLSINMAESEETIYVPKNQGM